uniref:Uncharacterized protein n=1 Tax=Sphaerodactylus townsendi TaxID=933632 RepID=A0ACB8F999_9SAUR
MPESALDLAMANAGKGSELEADTRRGSRHSHTVEHSGSHYSPVGNSDSAWEQLLAQCPPLQQPGPEENLRIVALSAAQKNLLSKMESW